MKITGKFSGVITPLVTPFKENGEIDFRALAEILDFVKRKVDGIFVNATTGEFTSLSLEEKMKIVEFVKQRITSKTKIIYKCFINELFRGNEIVQVCFGA